MNGDYWILLGAWLLFGLLHSLLATEPTKNLFRKAMGRTFKYYRLLYSLFAFFSLAAVLWWQFSIPAITLWSFPIAKYLAGLPAGIAGLWLMAACIRKYFFNLSGIGVFWGRGEGGGVLELDGLHRYVRHPLYLGTLLFVWSLWIFFPSPGNLVACGVITGYTVVGIRLEEKKLLVEFGPVYADYCRRTPMLIPGLRRLSPARLRRL